MRFGTITSLTIIRTTSSILLTPLLLLRREGAIVIILISIRIRINNLKVIGFLIIIRELSRTSSLFTKD